MKLLGYLVPIFFAMSLYAETIPEKIQKGMSLLNNGNVQQATDVLLEVIQENPQHGPARLLLGQIAIEQNQWKQAEEHLQIAVAAATRRPHVAWQLLGKLQLLQHKHSEARNAFEASLKESEEFVPALIGRARSSLFLNDAQSAVRDLDRAVAAGSGEAALLLGQTYLYLNRQDEARKLFASYPFETEEKQQAALLLQTTEREPSLQSLRKSAGENLGLAENYVALGMIDRENAESLFQIAFYLDDQNPIPYLFLSKSRAASTIAMPKIPQPEIVKTIAAAQQVLKNRQFDVAQNLAHKVLGDRPSHVPAELILIEIAEHQNDNWDALERYQKVVESIPGIPVVESRLGALAQKMGANDLAECHIKRALKVDPDSPYAHYVLGLIFKAKKQTDVALREAQKAIALGFQEATAYLLLGDLYYEKMEISKSIAALGTAIEINPHAAENIASFALSALTTEDYSALRKILEAHAKANPQNIETIYRLAMMHLNENNLQPAKEYFSSLVNHGLEQSQIYYNLGLVNFRLGLEREGTKAMERFEELKNRERDEWLKQNGAHKIRIEAKNAFETGNIADSIRLYSKLSSEGLAETADLLALAVGFARLNKQREALETFEKVLQHSPYNREALIGATESAKVIGRTDAMNLYSKRAIMLTQTCL